MTVDLVIKNARLVTPTGIIEGCLIINDSIITGISKDPHLPTADKTINANGNPVLSGPIDGHCHCTSARSKMESSQKIE